MRQIVNERGDGFLDMYEYTNAPLCDDADYLCDDGFHPNDFGYAEIAQRAYPTLAAAVERIVTP
jgi:lysophospholipase L1-like esterase